jgi:hypothetical protein
MKTEFDLEPIGTPDIQLASAVIVGQKPENNPYVNIDIVDADGKRIVVGVKDKDLELFAVNILKALGSDKLKK